MFIVLDILRYLCLTILGSVFTSILMMAVDVVDAAETPQYTTKYTMKSVVVVCYNELNCSIKWFPARVTIIVTIWWAEKTFDTLSFSKGPILLSSIFFMFFPSRIDVLEIKGMDDGRQNQMSPVERNTEIYSRWQILAVSCQLPAPWFLISFARYCVMVENALRPGSQVGNVSEYLPLRSKLNRVTINSKYIAP